jgi:hypothetical protein
MHTTQSQASVIQTVSEVDSLFSPAKTKGYGLELLITEYELQLVAIDLEKQMVLGVKSYKFQGHYLRSNSGILNSLMQAEGWFSLPFSERGMTCLFSKNTLTPRQIFEELDGSLLAKNHFEIEEGESLKYFPVARPDAVNLMAIPNQVLDFAQNLQLTKPIRSLVSCFLKKSFQTQADAHLWFDGQCFMIAIIREGALQFANTLQYSTTDEAAYFILVALQQNSVDTQTAKLEVGGAISEGDTLFSLLRKYIFNVEVMASTPGFYFAPTVQNLPPQQFGLLFFTHHCE